MRSVKALSILPPVNLTNTTLSYVKTCIAKKFLCENRRKHGKLFSQRIPSTPTLPCPAPYPARTKDQKTKKNLMKKKFTLEQRTNLIYNNANWFSRRSIYSSILIKEMRNNKKKFFPSRHFPFAIGFLLSTKEKSKKNDIFKAKLGKPKKKKVKRQQLIKTKLKVKNFLIFFSNEKKIPR